MTDPVLLTRRRFLLAPALLPLARTLWAQPGDPSLHHFLFDHVIGTSLDLDIRADSPAVAAGAAAATLGEIDRLAAILDTRRPDSEISRLIVSGGRPSSDLAAVFAAYDSWRGRTGGVLSITPSGDERALNVDALGKAYILDRAADVASSAGGVHGVVINIGGDIVARGESGDIAITDPAAWQDNAKPLTWVRLRDQAIATSGSYARGAHLVDARTGHAARTALGASAIARNAVDANALATMLCVTEAAEGLPIVERIHDADAIRIDRAGSSQRSSGFTRYERPRLVAVQKTANWPAGYELNISLTLTAGAAGGGQDRGYGRGGFGGGGGGRRGGVKRPYVAAWIEDGNGRLVRVLAFWADKERYYSEMSTFYSLVGRDERRLSMLARATRAAGNYHLVWDGLDDAQQPVAPGSYRVVIETNQEHGSYGKQGGVIVCRDKPAQITLSATANFEAVTIDFGPRPSRA